MLLHESPSSDLNRTFNHASSTKHEELIAAQASVEKLLNDSLIMLEEEEADNNIFIRWELGACWIQHLQDQKNTEKEKKKIGDKDKKQSVEKGRNEAKVEGLGKPLKILKNAKKKLNSEESSLDIKTSDEVIDGAQKDTMPSSEEYKGNKATENPCLLKDFLSDTAFTKLKESDTGLHLKVQTKRRQNN